MAEQLQSTEHDIIVPDELLATFLWSDALSVSASYPTQESVVSLPYRPRPPHQKSLARFLQEVALTQLTL